MTVSLRRALPPPLSEGKRRLRTALLYGVLGLGGLLTFASLWAVGVRGYATAVREDGQAVKAADQRAGQ